ncbi:hypothetical protein PPACK8108_LOCUS14288 [Phakopsora pachyrhizi]|uniref:Uncharacterized protein n=1 Tax=Phakopsora pachyrhizi TaxID=170000 RepID=A0AAV0B6Z8_PHAPC|nr:hypothetical protein PPACK8108_LOCUS14288 [Phakopsora pachyrhizi]
MRLDWCRGWSPGCFTLEEIEIWDGPQSGTGKVEGSGGFFAKDVVLARREAALFGLEKISIRRNNSSRISGGSSVGVKGSCLKDSVYTLLSLSIPSTKTEESL